ncbi:zinc finger, C3HC4 type, putative [Hepatocystis sp. ex Piliocolobus tephrosceles]|nr:zinc finger, C3HC4 type, putative [Hepatocystis sp. ex Piliocolobus tephrosceles]
MEDEENVRLRIKLNDLILILSICYSVFDIFIQWNSFSGCYKPIHLWLIVSFISILLYRFAYFLAQYLSNGNNNNNDVIIYRRNSAPYYINILVVFILFPFFFIWNIIGTIWIYQIIKYTPNCLPKNNNPWFIVLWIILCYIWILLYLFFIILTIYLEYQSRNFETTLRSMQSNNDIYTRWGDHIDLMRDYGLYFVYNNGLRLKQIESLPYYYINNVPIGLKCSICLNDFQLNECVRTLVLCNHTFHKSCIDLWLVRSATCPNCKSPIAAQGVFMNI